MMTETTTERKTGIVEMKRCVDRGQLHDFRGGPYWLDQRTKDALYHGISTRIAENIQDGREYVVRVFPVEEGEGLHNNVEFVQRAVVTLRYADDAEVGECVASTMQDGRNLLHFRREGEFAEWEASGLPNFELWHDKRLDYCCAVRVE